MVFSRSIVASVIVVAGCGKKPDCERYATQLTKLAAEGRSDSHTRSVESIALDSCNAGHVSTDEADCVIAAKTRAESLRCQGLEIMAKEAESALPRVRVSGFSVGIPPGWHREDTSTVPTLVSLMADDNHAALVGRFAATQWSENPLASDDMCRAMLVKNAGSDAAEMTVDSAKIVDTKFGKSCRTATHTKGFRHTGDLFVANRGDLMLVGCTFPDTEAKAPPGCQQMVDSIEVE